MKVPAVCVGSEKQPKERMKAFRERTPDAPETQGTSFRIRAVRINFLTKNHEPAPEAPLTPPFPGKGTTRI